MSSITLSVFLFGCFSTANAAPYETNMMPPFSIKIDDTTPKTGYVQVRNNSGAPFLHMTEAITAAFEAQNYTISKNPNEAYYVIHATIPQAGEMTELQHELLLSLGYGKTTAQPAESLALSTTSISVVPVVEPANNDALTAAATPETTNILTTPEAAPAAEVPTTETAVTSEISLTPTEEANETSTSHDYLADETETQDHHEVAELDNSPLVYAMTLDMQISIRKPEGKRVRYQVRISSSTHKTDASFETVAPELSKHLADGVVEIFRD